MKLSNVLIRQVRYEAKNPDEICDESSTVMLLLLDEMKSLEQIKDSGLAQAFMLVEGRPIEDQELPHLVTKLFVRLQSAPGNSEEAAHWLENVLAAWEMPTSLSPAELETLEKNTRNAPMAAVMRM